MARSHPPTLISIVKRTLREELPELASQKVLIAVSGGPDSMALLSVLTGVAERSGLRLFAHGVDHGIRAEARSELDLAERFSRNLGIDFSRSELRVGAGANLQARARTARHAALQAHAKRVSASWIATAHHADDRAETVLMRLLRGTSPRALAVLPPRSGNLVRPLIRARRRDILVHLARHRIEFAEDPSNRNPRFVRVRVRQELIPILEALSPKIVEHLTALADEVATTHSGSDWAKTPAGADEELALLGTAQRSAVRQMLDRQSRSARVRLRGGKELHLDVGTGKVTVTRSTGRARTPERSEGR